MTIEQKHALSKQIVSAIAKAEYYRGAINKIKRYPNTFYQGSFEIRLMGNRSAIWGEFTIPEALRMLRSKLKQAEIELSELEKKIK